MEWLSQIIADGGTVTRQLSGHTLTLRCGEKRGFSRHEFEELFTLARDGITRLVEMQKAAVA